MNQLSQTERDEWIEKINGAISESPAAPPAIRKRANRSMRKARKKIEEKWRKFRSQQKPEKSDAIPDLCLSSISSQSSKSNAHLCAPRLEKQNRYSLEYSAFFTVNGKKTRAPPALCSRSPSFPSPQKQNINAHVKKSRFKTSITDLSECSITSPGSDGTHE